MEELNHETGESFEGTRDTDCRTDFDEDAFGSVDVDFEFTSLVDRRVEKSKKTLVWLAAITMLTHKLSNLVGDIRSCVTDIAIHLAHDTDVLVTVQQRIFLLSLTT
jgi:hypothetical protein